MSGFLLLISTMGESFIGYTIIGGNISYWGGMVIIRFCSIIPIFGVNIIHWLWNGFTIMMYRFTFLYSLHFIIFMLIIILILIHISILHLTGSSRRVVYIRNIIKSEFSNKYINKDIVNIGMLIFGLIIILILPNLSNECDNFIEYNIK